MKRAILITALLILSALPAFAFLSFGGIDGAPGWKFERLTVIEDSVFVTILNDTDKEANFIGRIHFIGIMGNVLGKSRIYSSKFAPRSRQNFTSRLFYQTQNVGQAVKVTWGDVSVDYVTP